jgi:ankyrin repeat protein
VKFIYSCWSESVRQKSDDGRVPLHEAASSGDLNVARFLVMEWPESVRETSNDGRRPLHAAASSGKQPVARCLLHKFPESVHVKTVDSRLPLHEARRGHGVKWKNHQLALVRSLVVARRPQSLEEPDVHGATPLHIAVAQGPSSSLGIVKFLAEKSSKSLQFKDAHGCSPCTLIPPAVLPWTFRTTLPPNGRNRSTAAILVHARPSAFPDRASARGRTR